jgi:hypothetical protein
VLGPAAIAAVSAALRHGLRPSDKAITNFSTGASNLQEPAPEDAKPSTAQSVAEDRQPCAASMPRVL